MIQPIPLGADLVSEPTSFVLDGVDRLLRRKHLPLLVLDERFNLCRFEPLVPLGARAACLPILVEELIQLRIELCHMSQTGRAISAIAQIPLLQPLQDLELDRQLRLQAEQGDDSILGTNEVLPTGLDRNGQHENKDRRESPVAVMRR